jgi:tellurite resistance protein TehA-like permease
MQILPYQFKGLHVLSWIMFVLELVIYTVVWACFIARWTMYWKETKHRIFNDAEEIALTGAPAIVWFTISGLVALKCSDSWGYGFTVLAYVMWWIGMAWIIVQCSTLFICLSKESLTDDEHLPTAVFLPIVGVMTSASIGGIICNNAAHISTRMALPVIIVSYLCLGYALFLALAVYAAYLHRLIIIGWPPVEKIPAMILTVSRTPCRCPTRTN